MKKIVAMILVGAAAGSALAATVVKSVHPTWEVVVADEVMAPLEGAADAAPEIQRRIDALARREGGTLFLRAGTYRIASPVLVRANVTIKGDYAAGDLARSTVLSIVHGRGDEKAPATFQMDTSSGLQGLVFHYPEQMLAAPVPYPWTVRCMVHPSRAPDNQTLRDCTFVNAWQAISIGPESNELHTFRDLRICALKTGFHVDSTTDIGRVIDVTVSPLVWTGSGLKGAPSEKDLRAYLLSHDTTGADYGRSDWEYIWRLKVDGYRVGCRFGQGVRGTSNAVMAESAFTACETGLEVNELNGVGLAVYDTVFDCLRRSAFMTKRFSTVVQFLACAFRPAAPENEGSPASQVYVADGEGAPLRHVPMAWPRPKGETFVDVTAYGAATNAPDNAPAFARALAAAKAAGGGTVYVPGGWYDFRSGITVPSGVELRGCSATPHHTAAGGSVLMVRFGANAPDGAPFVSLEAGAGLRGLAFWYPENPTKNPMPYPWTVRSLGPDCYLADVNIANAWQGVDFASHPSAGHRIAYLSGVAWRTMLSVGKSEGTGWVEDTLFNPHYAVRLPPGFPVTQGAFPTLPPGAKTGIQDYSNALRARLEAHVFTDCADERIRGTFVYAARDGLAFHGKNRATVMMHGSDTNARGVEIDQRAGSEVTAALVQLVPFPTPSGKESAGFHFAPGDEGRCTFRASQLWVMKPTIIGEGRGYARFEMGNTLSDVADLRSGTFSFSDFRFGSDPDRPFAVGPKAKAEIVQSGLYPMPRGAKNPTLPPKDLVIGPGGVKPLQNTAARHGGTRGAGEWFARTEKDGSYHFKAHLVDEAYSYVYVDVLRDVQIPVYWNTMLTYRMKPLTPNVRGFGTVGFDFHFTDGTVMRICCPMAAAGNPQVGEWTNARLRLKRLMGKVIDHVMIRVDMRHNPGIYEALFDSIRFSNPKEEEAFERMRPALTKRGERHSFGPLPVSAKPAERQYIWPEGKMPDAGPERGAFRTRPYIDWYLPNPTGKTDLCVMTISGGGFNVCCDAERLRPAIDRLVAAGITVADVTYRTPRPKGLPIHQWGWEDVQRAVRVVKSEAKRRGFSPKKVGATGISAGAKAILLVATSSRTPAYAPVDEIDRLPADLLFAMPQAPAYVLSDGTAGENTREGDGPDISLVPELKFDEKTCPMCLLQGGADAISPLGSTHIARRLKKMMIPCELHLFADRWHGFHGDMNRGDNAEAHDHWFDRALEFIRQMNYDGRRGEEVEVMSRYPSDAGRVFSERENVWPEGRIPDFDPDQNIPLIEWHRPKTLRTRAIQVLYSGGSYRANGTQGFEVAPVRRYLNEKGMTVVTLYYRTPRPKDGSAKHISAWQDLQRAVRLVRAGAASRGLDPERIGIMGFSAGGHLTLMGATTSKTRSYRPIDAVDNLPCNAQWAVAVYPAYAIDERGRLEPEFAFDLATCPMLFLHGDADGCPVTASVAAWEQLRRMGIQGDLHTFATRGHCFQRKAAPGTGSYTYLDRVWEFLNHLGCNR